MSRKLKAILGSLLCLALLAAQGWPPAAAARDGGPPGGGAARSAGVSLAEAVAQVRHRLGGRILSAETVTRDGHRIHRIKVLTKDNRVRIVLVDARTGEWR